MTEKRLQPGEERLLKHRETEIRVKASCIDSDTPVITIIENVDLVRKSEIILTDVDADALIELLQKARRILPTSK